MPLGSKGGVGDVGRASWGIAVVKRGQGDHRRLCLSKGQIRGAGKSGTTERKVQKGWQAGPRVRVSFAEPEWPS